MRELSVPLAFPCLPHLRRARRKLLGAGGRKVSLKEETLLQYLWASVSALPRL